MEQLLLYLLKSAALLSIFFLVYQLLLRNDTSFQVNRGFLFWGIVASFVLPAVEFTRVVLVETAPATLDFANLGNQASVPVAPEKDFNWWQLAGTAYFFGLSVFLFRFLAQLLSLQKILRNGIIKSDGRQVVITSEKDLAPFSFFHYIVINPRLHSEEELQIILRHEKVHASQWHSVDVLLSNFTAALLWFNPLSWVYKKSLIQNLEYIADKGTVEAAVSKKDYQQTLVKISVPEYQPALANNFYQSLIKKRIIMLNKKPSQNLSYLKIGAVFPFILAFMFFFNVKTEAQVVDSAVVSSVTFKDDFKLSTIINKYTSEETLEAIVAMFKEEGVDLSFDIVEYSEGGLLTKIAVSFEKLKSGQTGNVNFHNSEGIGDFRIAMDKDSFTIEPVAALKPLRGLKSIGEQPLYIINNKEYQTSELVGKTIWIKGGLTYVYKENVPEKYGAKAKDGMIVIEDGEIIEDFKKALEDIDKQKTNVKNHYLSVVEGEKPREITLEVNTGAISEGGIAIIPKTQNINASQNHGQGVRIYSQESPQKRPFIIVNGDIKGKSFDINSIDPKTIERVQVLKEEDLLKKYGKKVENGVIVITIKGDSSGNEIETQEDFVYAVKHSDSTSSVVKMHGVSKANFENSDGKLYVLNGKIQDSAPKDIDPQSIEHINILKGDAAIKKYGEKAEKGVIEITLKETE